MNKYSHRHNLSYFSQRSLINKNLKFLPSATPDKLFTDRTVSRLSYAENGSELRSHCSSTLGDYNPISLNVPLEPDSRTSSISRLTVAQNEVMSSSLSKFSINEQTHKIFPNIETKKLLKSEYDYHRIISRLNQVISPNYSKRPILFLDSDTIEFSVDEHQFKYCKVYVKDKSTPMIVKIRRLRGKIITFFSSIETEPGPNNSERYFGSDYFEIRENSRKFKYDNAYLGIKALEDSVLSVSITFGKISSLIELKKIKRGLSVNSILKEDLKDEVEESPFHVSKDVKNSEKNFIVMNKTIKLLNSCLNRPLLEEKGKKWTQRRMQVLEKRKSIGFEKKIKNQDYLNKKILKRKKEREEKERNLIQQNKMIFEKTWLKLIHFYISVENVHLSIQANKKKKMRKLTWNLSAYKIQKNIKGYFKKMNVGQTQVLRARNLLLLYRQTWLPVCLNCDISSKIIDYVKNISYNVIFAYRFNVLIAKTLLIQKEFRKYRLEKHRRIQKLYRIWQEHQQIYLFRRSKKKSGRKRHSASLISISNPRKSAAISDYYHSCVIKFRDNLRKYLKTSKFAKREQRSEFLKTLMFEYIPTAEEIEGLIDRAIQKS